VTSFYPNEVAGLEALSEWVSHRVRHGTEGGRLGAPASAVTARHTTLTGTVALVTGASSGIGTATAALLAHYGADVALVARRRDRLDAVAAGIRAGGATAVTLECDITDDEQAAAAIGQTIAELGRLDTLVNNAGVMLLGPALDSPLAEWEQMVALNVLGTLRVTNAALPHLVRAADDSPRGVADLVMISSTAGRLARPGAGVYALTKFGIAAFADSLRQELIPRRVRVSVVEPGTVDTELASHLRDEIREAALDQMASIEALHPDDVADEVAHIVTRDRRVAINEVLVRAAEQTW
jgi:NADP-dependent 3-hydroxy acid dehydrogenase YdfG